MYHSGCIPLSDYNKEKICQEYAKDFNMERAFRESGAWVGSSSRYKQKILNAPEMKNRISYLMSLPKKVDISVEWVLENLKKIVNDCLYPTQLSTVVEKGPDGYIYRDFYKHDYTSALKALELIGKHLQMWSKDPLDPPGKIPSIQIITSPIEEEGNIKNIPIGIRLNNVYAGNNGSENKND